MSMRKMIVTLALTAGSGSLFLFAAGCEDAADAAADAKVDAIAAVQTDYNNTASSGNHNQALQNAATALSSNSSGSDGISASAALMEASVRMELVLEKLSQASVVEAENRGLRLEILGIAGGSQLIEGVAAGLGMYDGKNAEAFLNQAMSQSKTELEQANSTFADLEAPYNDFNTKNIRDKTVVTTLRDKAIAHRETAFTLGDGPDGLREIQNAVAEDRKADKLENAIAQRNVAMMGIRLELELARTKVERLNAQVESIRNAQAILDKSKADFANNASKLRSNSGEELRKTFTNARNSLNSNSSGTLNPLYGECDSELATAKSKCDAAGQTAENRSAAAILKARIFLAEAQMHQMKSRALADQETMLTILAGSDSQLGNTADFNTELSAVTTDRNAEQAAAKAAYGEAVNALNNVSGSLAGDIARLKAQLQQAAGS